MVYGPFEGRKIVQEAKEEAAMAAGDLAFYRSEWGARTDVNGFRDRFGTSLGAVDSVVTAGILTRLDAINAESHRAARKEEKRLASMPVDRVYTEGLGRIGIIGREGVILSAGIDPASSVGQRLLQEDPDAKMRIIPSFIGPIVML